MEAPGRVLTVFLNPFYIQTTNQCADIQEDASIYVVYIFM